MVEFNDPRLTEAVERLGPIIEGAEGRLNAISADIKQFEEYLAARVQQRVEMDLEEYLQGYIHRSESGVLYFEDGPDFDYEAERLAFDDIGGRWRLLYEKVRRIGQFEVETGEQLLESEETLDRKPLIETPKEIRIRASTKLVAFLRLVARGFAIDPSEVDNYVDPTEIPF